MDMGVVELSVCLSALSICAPFCYYLVSDIAHRLRGSDELQKTKSNFKDLEPLTERRPMRRQRR
ncbi:hypothetical protein TRIP_B200259 [uncultured Desulfatiglans sp.]|nr:hypothetical protein TRIP_B200259 [uncultured Desulfatiglans sp.]